MIDGMNLVVILVGFEVVFDLENDWCIENCFRILLVSGNFIFFILVEVVFVSFIVFSIVGDGVLFVYVNGGLVGEVYGDDDLVMCIYIFDVMLNDMGLIVNDFKLIKLFFDDISVIFGYFVLS